MAFFNRGGGFPRDNFDDFDRLRSFFDDDNEMNTVNSGMRDFRSRRHANANDSMVVLNTFAQWQAAKAKCTSECKVIVIDWYSKDDWCPHCPRLAPLVEQYQEKLKEEQVVFYKIYLPESGYSIVGEVCNDIGISSINAVPKLTVFNSHVSGDISNVKTFGGSDLKNLYYYAIQCSTLNRAKKFNQEDKMKKKAEIVNFSKPDFTCNVTLGMYGDNNVYANMKREGFGSIELKNFTPFDGKWYYEMILYEELYHNSSIGQVGWALPSFKPNSRNGEGVGDDKYSWGYDGGRQFIWINRQKISCGGGRWSNGDVIGCSIDIDDSILGFYKNGRKIKKFRINQKFAEVYPAISFARGFCFQINLGAPNDSRCTGGKLVNDELKYLPEDHKSVQSWFNERVFQPNDFVKVSCLKSSKKLNNKKGKVISQREDGRYLVKIDGKDSYIKPANLTIYIPEMNKAIGAAYTVKNKATGNFSPFAAEKRKALVTNKEKKKATEAAYTDRKFNWPSEPSNKNKDEDLKSSPANSSQENKPTPLARHSSFYETKAINVELYADVMECLREPKKITSTSKLENPFGKLVNEWHANRYKDLTLIGKGSSGVVISAHDNFIDSTIAFKFTLDKKTEREHTLLLRAKHKNICEALDCCGFSRKSSRGQKEAGIFCMAMEYIDGDSLETVLKNHKKQKTKMSNGDFLILATNLLDTLEHFEKKNIIHRDLKPGNILWHSKKKIWKVIDFGISLVLSEKKESNKAENHIFQTSKTSIQKAIGTLAYMSPEQLDDSRAPDSRSDIWAVGIILYSCLSGGKFPFELPDENSSENVYNMKIRQSILSPSALSKLPTDAGVYADAIDKALQKNPDNRWLSASEFRNALLHMKLKAFNEPGHWDYFISHAQVDGATLAEAIYSSMKYEHHKRCWLDVKMKERDEEAMQEGVRNSSTFLAIVSEKYFTRPFCIKELEWAIKFEKGIVVVIDVGLKSKIGDLLQLCPQNLRTIGSINFIDLNRGDVDYWKVGMKKILEAERKVLIKPRKVMPSRSHSVT